MGSVWAATHTVTLRKVALKFVSAPAHLKEELRKRFLREARAASAIQHPNVVQVHDFFELDSDTPVMVMDLLDGETLAQLFARERKLSLGQMATILLQVVAAVGTAHGKGIVHRDLKPDNVFLAKQAGQTVVKVLDFGIAKLSSDNPLITEGGVITNSRTMLGTPCYMAPEQSLGEPDVDHRADIWALGAIMYEALTGTRAVDGANIREVLKRLLTESITPIQTLLPDLPSEVAELIDQMLAYERVERPDDLRAVHEVLYDYAAETVRTFAPPASHTFEPLVTSRRFDVPPPNPTNPIPPPDSPTIEDAASEPKVDPAARTEHAGPPTLPESPAATVVSGSEPISIDVGATKKSRRVGFAAAALVVVGTSLVAWQFSSSSEASAAPTKTGWNAALHGLPTRDHARATRTDDVVLLGRTLLANPKREKKVVRGGPPASTEPQPPPAPKCLFCKRQP
jgi:serine/threonine protein kinase